MEKYLKKRESCAAAVVKNDKDSSVGNEGEDTSNSDSLFQTQSDSTESQDSECKSSEKIMCRNIRSFFGVKDLENVTMDMEDLKDDGNGSSKHCKIFYAVRKKNVIGRRYRPRKIKAKEESEESADKEECFQEGIENGHKKRKLKDGTIEKYVKKAGVEKE